MPGANSSNARNGAKAATVKLVFELIALNLKSNRSLLSRGA